MKPVLTLSNISCTLGSVKVLKDITLSFYSGEIHSIVGENGAGKTTLVHIISGLLKPDNGEMMVIDRVWSSLSFQTALKLGILIVPQELILPKIVSLSEYIFMGREPSRFGLIDYNQMEKETIQILSRLQLNLNPNEKVGNLNLAQKRLLAIARAVSLSPRILILDEATNFFSSAERELFNRLIRILQEEGMCVIHITHKLDEVMQISDRITILRDGSHVKTSLSTDINRNDVISYMVGREYLKTYFWKPHYSKGEEILRIENLSIGTVLKDINLHLKEGEVLGLAGLVGSGRTMLGKALYGMEQIDLGSIYIDGEKYIIDTPAKAIELGIGYISDDRQRFGTLKKQSLGFNLTINVLKRLSSFFIIRRKRERYSISDALEKYVLRKYSPDQTINTLSGGTQQKVAFARTTSEMPKVLVIDEPTREIDIEGQKEIFSIINNLAAEKVAVILISSVLGHLISNCDRILVMKSGQIVKELRKTEFNEEIIMHYAIDSPILNTVEEE